MPDPELGRKIRARRRGNRFGFWFFRIALRFSGLRGAYGLLYIVVSYYILFDWRAVRTTMAYVKRRFPSRSLPRQLLSVYLLFVNQGKCLIDRYYSLSGLGEFDVSFDGYEKIKPVLEDKSRGFILLLSHAGNWQMIMTTIQNLERKVYLLMRPEDNAAVQESLGLDKESSMLKTISPEQFMGGVVEMMKVLEEGHIVAIMGDRAYGFASETVSFLGDKALFPGGAFTLAAATGTPILVFLPAKLATRKYNIKVADVFRVKYPAGIEKRQALRAWLQQFADILEGYVKEYPHQCFLFHDIWSECDQGKIQK